MKRSWLSASILAAGLTAAVCGTQEAAAPAGALTAEQVLKRMADVYASCRSYRDTGWRRLATDMNGQRLSNTANFTTAFIRPDRFRFEQSGLKAGPLDRRIIWRKGKEVLVWCRDCANGAPGTRKEEALYLPVASILAGDPPHFIIKMLMPDRIAGRGPADIKGPKRLPDEKLGKRDFYRVKGTLGEFPCDLWIEKKTFTLQRMITGQPYGTKEAAIEPLLNPADLAGRLELSPPR